MADTPYQRSIDQAARTLAAANADWQRISDLMGSIPSSARDSGGARENEYTDLSKQLDAASKRFNASEQAYQDAIQLADRAQTSAKEFLAAGTTRRRLDTTSGNVLVAVTEIADGRGGWSVDPNTPVQRVAVEGADTGGTRITAPASDKFIVTMAANGTLTQKDNPNYQPDKNAGPSAVPTSEYIYQDGAVKPNPAYRPPAPVVNTDAQQIPDPSKPGSFMPNPNYRAPNVDINTSAQFINDPDRPGQTKPNPNYRAPSATVNTQAEYIDNPAAPGTFIKNPNYKTPEQQLTPGGRATDTAIANTAEATAAANLKTAQTKATQAEVDLANAQRQARQAPTDTQAQAAIQTAQRSLDLAIEERSAALEQLRKLNPIAAQQAEANLQRTQEQTKQAKLGDLYGLKDRVKEIRDLIASGEIDPKDGDNMIAAAQRGTTVYDVMKQSQADRSTARGQDVSNKNQLAGTFGSTFNSGLSTIADMNKYAAVGSSAGADAFVALLNMAQDRLKQYELPPATPTDYLGPSNPLSGVISAAQQQVAPAAVPAGTGAQPITINIGSGAASNPQPQGFSGTPSPAMAAMTAGAPSRGSGGEAAGGPPPNALSGMIGMAAREAPVTNGEVIKTLYPTVAQKFGLL